MPPKDAVLRTIKEFFIDNADFYKEEQDYQFIDSGIIKLERLVDRLMDEFLILKK